MIRAETSQDVDAVKKIWEIVLGPGSVNMIGIGKEGRSRKRSKK